MMNLNFSKREKMILYFLVSLLAAYLIYLTVYEVFWVSLNDLKAQITKAQQEFSQDSAMLAGLSSRLNGQGDFLESFRQKESDGAVRSKMLATLQTLSAKQNVQIVDMKPAPVRSENSYKEFPVSVKLEGEFVDIMRFLFFAESRRYGFRIQEFRFSRSYSVRSLLQCQVVLSRVFLSP